LNRCAAGHPTLIFTRNFQDNLIFVLVYGLYVGYFYTIQRHAIFPRHLIAVSQHTISDFPGWQQDWIALADAQVESWYLPPARPAGQRAPVIIITHGNGDLMESWASHVTMLQQQGLGVLLVEYPGYGRSTGEPSQERIAASRVAAYDRLVQRPEVDPHRVILFGFSVGGGAIGTLAAARPSPRGSLCPPLPACALWRPNCTYLVGWYATLLLIWLWSKATPTPCSSFMTPRIPRSRSVMALHSIRPRLAANSCSALVATPIALTTGMSSGG